MSSDIVVGIVGGGFVGSAHARALIDAGFKVLVHDINENYQDNFPQFGSLPDVAPLEALALTCHIILVCVPTPPLNYGDNDTCGEANISIVDEVLFQLNEFVGNHRKPSVCIKSTLPPETTRNLQALSPNLRLSFSPEFLTEADPLGTLTKSDRIVLGSDLCLDGDLIYVLESINVNPDMKLVLCSSTEAELIKLMSNSFLAMKVTFANWFYDICGMTGANYEMVRLGVELDPRIGPSHLRVPGNDGKRGYSGSCFPKDVGNIVAFCHLNGLEADVMDVIQKANSQYRTDHDWVANRYREEE